MTKLVVPVEIEALEEGGYLAICEVIQGCHAEGETVAEALENLEGVARTLLEVRREDGLSAPDGLERFEPGTIIKAQVVVQAAE